MRKKKLLSRVVLGLLVFMCVSTVAWGEQIILPDPTDVLNGVPVAIQFDDFYSYSADLLSQLQAGGYIPMSNGDYTPGAGTGVLGLVLASQSSRSNVDVGGTGYTLESSISGTNQQIDPLAASSLWGNGYYANGPVYVDNLLNWMQSLSPGMVTPVFGFDLNQTGSKSDISVIGRVLITEDVDIFSVDNPEDYIETAEKVCRWGLMLGGCDRRMTAVSEER